MITEYDISPWTEKYPDPWIRLIEYFPYCKQAQILKNRRYHLVKRRSLDLTKNQPALTLEVSGNFYNDDRAYLVKRGGECLYGCNKRIDADEYFSFSVNFQYFDP